MTCAIWIQDLIVLATRDMRKQHNLHTAAALLPGNGLFHAAIHAPISDMKQKFLEPMLIFMKSITWASRGRNTEAHNIHLSLRYSITSGTDS